MFLFFHGILCDTPKGGKNLIIVSNWSEQSGFKPWLETLCCVLGQDTNYSHGASLHPGVSMGTGELNAGCDGLVSHPGGSRNTPTCFML